MVLRCLDCGLGRGTSLSNSEDFPGYQQNGHSHGSPTRTLPPSARLEGRKQIVVVFLRDRDKMHEKPSPCEGPKIKRDLKECIGALGFRV